MWTLIHSHLSQKAEKRWFLLDNFRIRYRAAKIRSERLYTLILAKGSRSDEFFWTIFVSDIELLRSDQSSYTLSSQPKGWEARFLLDNFRIRYRAAKIRSKLLYTLILAKGLRSDGICWTFFVSDIVLLRSDQSSYTLWS